MKRNQRYLWPLLILALSALAGLAHASVTISPSSVQLKAGASVQFVASGSGGVFIWSLSGPGCSGISCGSISSSGFYTAPSAAPTPATVTVSASSLFDLSQVGTAAVTIGTQGVAISVSPSSATVAVKQQQQFTASVSGSSNTGVTWTVSGVGCVSGSCGSISSTGLYTAPAAVPTPAVATVTAASNADPSKTASASVVITQSTAVVVSVLPGSAAVPVRGQQQFSANVTGSTNTAVKWSLSGSGCSGSACGTISAAGLYTAPATAPSPAIVNVVATSVADSSAYGTATVTITSGSSLTLTPALPQVKPQGKVQFSVSGPGSGIVVWSVNGSGCAGIACGSISSTGLYTAPATAPTPDTVTVTATSITNPGISGSTTVTISSSTLNVSISPATASVGVGAKQQFTATVSGNSNTAVTWSISGFACADSTCGTISSSGLYTAPALAPNPPFFNVVATSSADPSKSASAEVTLVQKVGLSLSPASAQVAEGQSQKFTATVTGTQNTAVTWSLSGAGCSGAECGTITSAGIYTAPDSLVGPVTVTATSAADQSVTASSTVTIIAPVVVTLSPSSVIVAVGAQQPFQVSVTGSANKAVTWSVSGSGCSAASCGTISTAGVYTAPATLPSPATVIVKATSQAMTTASAVASVTLVGSNNSKLAGQYAFSFTGYDSNGAYLIAGSFTADGSGSITDGQEDVNNMTGPSTNVALSGSYSVTSDNRGTLTLKSSLGTFTYKLALNPLGKKGRLISFDDSGVRGSGVLAKQDPAAFDPSAFANGYVLALSGADGGGGRVAALGLIYPDGSGFVSGSTMDVNDAGSVSPTYAPFSGVYSVDATGRGTATLILPGLGSGALNFAFYVVSANEFLMVSTDPVFINNMILAGPAEVQNGAPFFSSSFTGPSVFSMTGTTGSAPQATIGRFNFDGVVNVSAIFDQNNAGNVTVTGTMTGAYDMELNGRGTLNLNTPHGSMVWYIYATGPNQGFVMDASSMAAGIGPIFAQTAVPPFSNEAVLGSYLMGPDDPVVQNAPLVSAVTNFDGGGSVGGKGAVTGAEDISRESGRSINQVVTGTYSVSSVSNNGRGVVLLTSPTGANIAIWVANPSEIVGLDLSSTTTEPAVLHFEQ